MALLVNPQDQLLALLQQQETVGYIGEPVSQLAHALQCAAFAARDSADESLILAALLHDVGHFCDPRAPQMADLGVRQHETVGADYLLACGLDEAVATLVANHVNAKRYLVAARPAYAAKLSAASTQTLTFQGGPMSPAEVAAFEQHPNFDAILKLRAWDEAAKQPALKTPPLAHYADMLARNQTRRLNKIQLAFFAANGYLHIRDWFNADEIKALTADIDVLEALPDTAGKRVKY